MPFKANDELTKKWAKMGGRKGAVIEDAQQKEMTELFSRYLILANKISNEEDLNDRQWKAYDKLEKLVLKAMDKIHGSKDGTTPDGEPIKSILVKFINGNDNRDTK